MAKYPRNFRHVVENIYAGAAPTADDMAALNSLGIKYVLSLDSQAGTYIADILKQYKIHQIFIPINPVAYITDNLKYLLRNLTRILQNQPIYIHCLAGQDRTSFIIAVYRILKYNYNPKQAISEAKQWGYGLGISPQTQKFWFNILTILASSKNPNDVGSIDDGQISQDLYDTQGINKDEHSFPYIAAPNGSIRQMTNDNLYQQSVAEDKNISPTDRLFILKQILKDQEEIPQVGMYNNVTQLSLPGAGMIEPANFFNRIDFDK